MKEFILAILAIVALLAIMGVAESAVVNIIIKLVAGVLILVIRHLWYRWHLDEKYSKFLNED